MSNNLVRPQVASNQAQKHVTINDSDGILDAALTEVIDLDFTSGNITLTTTEHTQHLIFRCTNVAAARDLTVPNIKRGLFIVDNSSGANAVTVKRGSTSKVVNPGKAKTLFTDGTTNGLFEGGGSGSDTVQFAFFIGGLPGDAELVFQYVVPAGGGFTLPSGLGTSEGYADTDPAGDVSFDILKNGVPEGTVDFATGAQTATFTFTGDVVFTTDDVLQIVAPSPDDADLANVSITIVGNKA